MIASVHMGTQGCQVRRKLWWMAGLVLLSAGGLGASSVTCSFSGSTYTSNGCYNVAGRFSPTDFLDWGSNSAFGEAFGPGGGNPHKAGTPWDAQSNGSSEMVAASLDPSTPATYITRVDNTGLAWNGSSWDSPSNVSEAEYGRSNVQTFQGHFTAPPSNPQPGYQASSVQFGDRLIGTSDSSGAVTQVGPMILSFSAPVSSIGFRISIGGGVNANFDAILIASGANGVIGTYSIAALGSGGICSTLSSPNPVSCDDAPWIGFTDALADITKVSVEAFDPVTHNDTAFVIGTLEFDTAAPQTDAPEPSGVLLVGAGLLAVAACSKCGLLKSAGADRRSARA